MAAASGCTMKSDHARVKRHGLWRSGAALMSGNGWNDDRWGEGKMEGQGGPGRK
jgi:hypothetical protein